MQVYRPTQWPFVRTGFHYNFANKRPTFAQADIAHSLEIAALIVVVLAEHIHEFINISAHSF